MHSTLLNMLSHVWLQFCVFGTCKHRQKQHTIHYRILCNTENEITSCRAVDLGGKHSCCKLGTHRLQVDMGNGYTSRVVSSSLSKFVFYISPPIPPSHIKEGRTFASDAHIAHCMNNAPQCEHTRRDDGYTLPLYCTAYRAGCNTARHSGDRRNTEPNNLRVNSTHSTARGRFSLASMMPIMIHD